MPVSQASPAIRAMRARPVVDPVPATKIRVARGLQGALGLAALPVLPRVIPETVAAAVETCAASAAQARPAIRVERLVIEVEIPPATGADTPRLIAEE
jgi:hypothetical protein